MRTRWKVLLIGLLVIIVVGSIALGVIPQPCKDCEDIGRTGTVLDTSILDVAPVQVLKITLKGGDIE